MQVWRSVAEVPDDGVRSAVAIGVFDGVHIGHQAVVKRAVAAAVERGGTRSVVVTFHPHPAAVVRPGTEPPLLTTLERRIALVAELGVDAVCVLPFTKEFSQLSPAAFAGDVLAGALRTAVVVVGENFRFGHRAAGDVALLAELGAQLGFTVVVPPVVTAGGAPASSTAIRSALAAGDAAAAAAGLGRPYQLDGVVVAGDRRGRELGFPTANLAVEPGVAVPADGVYAGWLVRGQQRLPAAISVGSNPTFDGAARRVEAYVLDFDGDLYGERVGVEFLDRLRDMHRFDRVADLVEEMHRDVARTRAKLAGHR